MTLIDNVGALIQSAAGLASVMAALIAAVAALVAAKQLRSQALSQRLSSVIATNDLWRLVQNATSQKVKLRRQTVESIIAAHARISPTARSSLQRSTAAVDEIELPAPFIVGALQTLGLGDISKAPVADDDYTQILKSRGRVVGYTLTSLARKAEGVDPDSQVVAQDLRSLRNAIEGYVNVMNEVTELYEAGLVDRRLFLGKRHVSLIQQAYFVEPYVLWRNSVNPGRWGLRLLSIGREARRYHCVQVLQQSAVRGRNDPINYGIQAGYQGFAASVGWMLGPGAVSDNAWKAFVAERRARLGLGRGFSERSKRRQNEAIQSMPRTAGSGYAAPPTVANERWEDFLANPTSLAPDVARIQNG